MTLEELYNLQKNEVNLKRVQAEVSGKWLEVFDNPSPEHDFKISIMFPEFTCVCPRTSHPDFATIIIKYIPEQVCVELKALKYYLNSFRNEGHFHEQVTNLIYKDLWSTLHPRKLQVTGEFNVRGGTYPTITVGEI